MKPVFENRYVGTMPMLMEYIRKIALRKLLHACGIGIWLALGMTIYLIVTGDRGNAVVSGAFLVLFALLRSFAPLMFAAHLARVSREMFEDQEVETCIAFADKIYMTEGEASVSVEYSQITEVLELNEIYALKTGEKGAVLVARGKFTAGDERDFMSFLRARCTHADMPDMPEI